MKKIILSIMIGVVVLIAGYFAYQIQKETSTKTTAGEYYQKPVKEHELDNGIFREEPMESNSSNPGAGLDREENDLICNMEAKACPDGTYIERTGPHCEFAKCPGKKMNDNFSTKTSVKTCSREYRPVCGGFDTGIRCIKAHCPSFKEKTYANICLLKKDNAEFLYNGECREKIPENTDQPPVNCTSWFDGCNTCGVINGKLTVCTQMACEAYQLPKCLDYK